MIATSVLAAPALAVLFGFAAGADRVGAWPWMVVMCRPRCMAMPNAFPHFPHVNFAAFLRGIFVSSFVRTIRVKQRHADGQ
jgi:hypothetical protein